MSNETYEKDMILNPSGVPAVGAIIEIDLSHLVEPGENNLFAGVIYEITETDGKTFYGLETDYEDPKSDDEPLFYVTDEMITGVYEDA